MSTDNEIQSDEVIERLKKLCREGDGLAALHLAKHAHRTESTRLFDFAMAGSLLCEDLEHPCKTFYALGLASMVLPKPLLEGPAFNSLPHWIELAKR